MTTAISVHNLGKQYKIGAAETKFRYNMLRDVIVDTVSAPIRLAKAMIGKSDRRMNQNYVWALQDVSFDLEEGKVLGVVGRNGAGKSNIYMNGAILGMKRSEIDSKFDEIVDFSEVNQFIDTPVKRYSSGMYLRLAFAVAAHLEPEILVVDEVLAVGDAEFQKKCLGKMGDVAQQGRTVLFVSHNMSAILRLTQEAIVLNKGRMIMRGPTQEAVDYYLSSGQSQAGERVWEADEIPAASQPFRPISLKVKERGGKVVDTIRSTESAVVEFEYQLSAPVTGLRVGLYVGTMRGEYVFASFDTDTPELYEKFDTRDAGRYVSRAEIPADIFNEGRYTVGVNASSFGVRRYFMDENALAFNVDISGAPGTQWGEPRVGPVRPRLAWKIEKIRD
ncbi:MAG: ABC transporter ATP-binding protein [Chloroflexi bacterium CFX1]|nr:ABC transporter ATP-binding protein [Chloroflexi bacterium CFX1]